MNYDMYEDTNIIRVSDDWDISKDKILDHIDFSTGEIIPTVEYETVKYKYSNFFTEGDLKEHKRTSKIPQEFNSKYELDSYMSGVDRRKLVTFNSIKERYGQDRYNHDIENKVRELNTPMTKTLKKLIENLDYRNIIIDTKQGLAKKLGVDKSNLLKTLKTCKWLVRVHTEKDGMKRGHIKVLVHPDFGFRHLSPKHSSCNVNSARRECLKEWIKPSFEDVSGHTDWLINPDKHTNNNYSVLKDFPKAVNQ